MVIELKIDGMKVVMDQKSKIAATHSIADIEEPDGTASGYTKSVEVPLMSNMRVFRFTNELYSREQFNNELHKAEYIVDGNTVMSGIAQIDKITYKFGSGYKLVGGSFHVSVIGAAFDWITNAKKQINELESAETVVYNMGEVYKNSIREDESLIKFFPVDRGAFWEENYNGDLIPRKKLDIRDYHPFFNVWKTMCLILSGYTIKSSIEDFFKKLYCSGYMPVNEDLSYIKEDNDFYIGTSATEEAELLGYINANRPTICDNIFDSWTDGDYHNDNGVISRLDPMIPQPQFTPTDTAVVRMNMNLQYQTDIFNGIIYHPGQGVKDPINLLKEAGECLFIDTVTLKIGGFEESIKLTLDQCVEAHEGRQGDKSHIRIPADSEDKTYVVYIEFAEWQIAGSMIAYTGYPGSAWTHLGNHKVGGYGNWYIVDVPQKWSCSFEGIEVNNPLDIAEFYYFPIENGKVTFQLNNIMQNAYLLNKDDKYVISTEFTNSKEYAFQGDKKQVNFWIGSETNIKPEFPNVIAQDYDVSIATIGGTGSQLDFLASLRQMFNLMFYTNPLTKEVFVEPRTRFYNLDRAEIVDWREKIDYSKQIEVEELGGDIGNKLKLAYADGNEVVQYYNWKNKVELGAYSVPLLNRTADDTKEIVNGTFAPFLLRRVESVGMTLPQEKRETTQDDIRETDLSITPIVGYFDGLAIRTAGADLNPYSHYPRLLFQDEAKGVNLGFEDITGVTLVRGLRQYYEDNISAYNYGRRITMHLRLTPQDVEPFQFPNERKQDLRAVFLLNMDGEDVPCILEEIADYNPASGAATKCVFISDPRIKLTGDDLTVITYDDEAISRNNALTGYR